MSKHVDCIRGFTHLSRAWYADANLKDADYVDEIVVGFYHPEGGTTGEFAIKWAELGGKIVLKLSVYDDAWDALLNFKDLLELMAIADDQNITPDEFCILLRSLGIEDRTKETRDEC